MQFTEVIQKVNSDKRLIPDLTKSEKGNNFRAISESAILDVIDPILKESRWWYDVRIQKSDLQIREAYGSKGKKLQFIATVEIKLVFHYDDPDYDHYYDDRIETEAVGMGIDDNDKAMGKAYTYAIKYALLKLFRLRYGDDPDAKASEPLYMDKPKEDAKKDDEKKSHEKKSTKKTSEQAMTEKQRDYILGMMEQKGINSQIIMGKFNGTDPKEDEYIPMTVARAIIKWLEEQDNLPF
jgi:hypothetical protein